MGDDNNGVVKACRNVSSMSSSSTDSSLGLRLLINEKKVVDLNEKIESAPRHFHFVKGSRNRHRH